MLAVLTTSPQPSCVFSKFDVLVFVDPILLSDLNGNDDGRLLTFMSNPFVFGNFLSCFFSSTSIYNGTTRFLLWCHENCPSDRKRPFHAFFCVFMAIILNSYKRRYCLSRCSHPDLAIYTIYRLETHWEGVTYHEGAVSEVHLALQGELDGLSQVAPISSGKWGFEGEDLGNSPGRWAATVATYCPSKPGELPKSSSSKPHDQ